MIGKRHDEKNLLKESLKRAILKESFRNVLHRVLLRESKLSKIDPDIIQNIITNVKPAEVAAGTIFSVYYINKSENKKKGKRSPEDFKKDVEEFTEEIAKKFKKSDEDPRKNNIFVARIKNKFYMYNFCFSYAIPGCAEYFVDGLEDFKDTDKELFFQVHGLEEGDSRLYHADFDKINRLSVNKTTSDFGEYNKKLDKDEIERDRQALEKEKLGSANTAYPKGDKSYAAKVAAARDRGNATVPSRPVPKGKNGNNK